MRTSIRSISDGATPLMDEVTATVTTTNQQLKKVDGIASNVSDASANISALSSLVAATVGSPLIKVAAFSYGVRSAFSHPQKARHRPPQPLSPPGEPDMNRIIWMGIGVAIGVIAFRKVTEAQSALGPEGLNRAVGRLADGLLRLRGRRPRRHARAGNRTPHGARAVAGLAAGGAVARRDAVRR